MGNNLLGKKQVPQIKKVPTAMEIKTYIMVAQNKLTLFRNKKVHLIKQKRKEIAKHLRENNLDIAKAKMESVIREEDLITVYDILGPICEILKEKITYLLSSNECPSDLRAPLDTIIYSSTRIEFEEFHKLRDLIMLKYGPEYIAKGDTNADKLVNVNLIEKLKVKPSADAFITIRLKQLCKEDGVNFEFPCEIIGLDPGLPMDQHNPFAPDQPINPYASTMNPYQGGGYGGDFQPNNNMNPYQGNINPYQGNPNFDGGNQNPYGGFGGFNAQNNVNQGNPNPGGFGQFNAEMSYPNPNSSNPYDNSNNFNPYGDNMQGSVSNETFKNKPNDLYKDNNFNQK